MAFLVASARGATAGAQDTIGTVLIVRVPRDAGVVARIRAELEANDFRVREVGPDASSARAALPLLAANAKARAALRMQPTRIAIELWVASEGGAAGGGEIVRAADDGGDDALLAVRVTEAMRARGMRLARRSEPGVAPSLVTGGGAIVPATAGSAPSTAGGTEPAGTETAVERDAARKQAEAQARAAAEAQRQAEANKQAEAQRQAEANKQAEAQRQADADKQAAERREAEQRAEAQREADAEAQAEREAEEAEAAEREEAAKPKPLIFVEAGLALAASPNSYAASVQSGGWINLRLQPAALWSISALGFLPFAGGTIENDDVGKATLRTFLAGGTFDVHAPLTAADLSAGAGAALVITHMAAAGDPEMGFETAQVDDKFTGAILLRGAFQVALATRVRLSARVVFGFAFPELEVNFPTDPATTATWGQPFGLASIGVDYGLPEPLRPH